MGAALDKVKQTKKDWISNEVEPNSTGNSILSLQIELERE